MTGIRSVLLPAAALFGLAAAALGQTPWGVAQGKTVVTPTVIYEAFDSAYVGEAQLTTGQILSTPVSPELSVQTFLVNLEYGVTDRLTLDLTVGYTRASGDLPDAANASLGPDEVDGLADSLVGLRYKVLDEFANPSLPTVSLRVGAVLAGTYDEGLLNSPGDGANAVEASVLFGRLFAENRFGVFGNLGYRFRDNDSPNDLFYRISAFGRVTDGLTLGAGYSAVLGQDGPDILGPGFGRFPQVKEEQHLLEAYASVTDGPRQYTLILAQTLDGRNTPDKTAIALTVGFEF